MSRVSFSQSVYLCCRHRLVCSASLTFVWLGILLLSGCQGGKTKETATLDGRSSLSEPQSRSGAAVGEPTTPDTPDAAREGNGSVKSIPSRSFVYEENQRGGADDWPILNPGDVAGYAMPEAVVPGQAVSLHVHAATAGQASFWLYRMGYYAGKGARLVATGSFWAGPQPMPLPTTDTGLVECAWPASVTIQTGADWPSGYYVAKVQSAGGVAQYVPFTVVNQRSVAILVSLPTLTYQAYNFFGGMSLYVNGYPNRFPNHDQAVAVSFLRPYATDGGAGQFLRLDHYGVKWLEAAGFDIGYTTNAYVSVHPEILQTAKLYLSLGHDEYWTDRLRDALEAARDRGLHQIYWSGNTGLWQVRLEPSQGQAIGRMIGYKHYAREDPMNGIDPQRVSGAFRDPPINRPENALLGIMWDCCGIAPSPWRPWVGADRIWSGTGLVPGVAIPRVVGGEFDRRWNNGAEPKGLEVLAESPIVGATTLLMNAHSTRYRAASGAWIYAMGSITWQEALGKAGETNVAFQQFNANVLRLVDEPRGNIHPPDLAPRRQAEGATWLESRVTTLAGESIGGWVDGALSAARFNEPRAVAVGPGGLFVADARNGALRVITGTTVRTVTRCLRFPNGVAAFADGGVYVSDAWAHAVWEVDVPTGTCRLLAGGNGVSRDGVGSAAGFANLNPIVAVPTENAMYALDLPFGVRRIDRAGRVTTPFSTGLQGWSVVRVPDGYYMSYPDELRIVGLGVPGLAGSGEYGTRDGAVNSAAFTAPATLIAGRDGSLYVVDLWASSIRRIRNGQVVTVAGSGYGFADGEGRAAKFRYPTGLALREESGELFVADTGNHRIRVVRLP